MTEQADLKPAHEVARVRSLRLDVAAVERLKLLVPLLLQLDECIHDEQDVILEGIRVLAHKYGIQTEAEKRDVELQTAARAGGAS